VVLVPILLLVLLADLAPKLLVMLVQILLVLV
jgi:hypothetical protein